MKKNSISKILKKYLSGRFPNETEERVQKWIIKDNNSEEKEQASQEYWDELDVTADSNTYTALDRVNRRIGYLTMQAVKIPLYSKISRIAVVLIPFLLIAGGYLYHTYKQSEMIEVSVAYGDTKYLLLPDSSEIWINAGTNIRYPKNFSKSQREVHLNGEAYFSVKENKAKPFIVQTERLSVKVLGTKFNVRAYSIDEKVVTSLTSGKVEVDTQSDLPKILKPNEQLTYNKNTSDIHIENIQASETDGWLKGKLIFNNASLNDILTTLERNFNISIENETGISSSKLYTVKFLKDENIDEILSVLEGVIGFTSQKQEGKIILSEKR